MKVKRAIQKPVKRKKDKIKQYQTKRYQQLIQHKKKRYKINEFCFFLA